MAEQHDEAAGEPARGSDASPVQPGVPVRLQAEELRRPLRREEIPLPPGGDFSLDILLDERKAAALIEYRQRQRIIKEERAILYKRCKEDKEYRSLVYERCRRDARYFIDYFCWTYDDRRKDEEIFVLYDFQVEKIVKPYELFCRVEAPSRVTLGYAKSRGIGFTWVVCATRLRNFLFWDNWSILMGTENRDDVDDGGQTSTHQTLMGKVRFMIDKLPDWMRSDLLGPLYDKDEYNKRWHIRNPKRPRNMIDGKQLGAMFGRQRRYSEAFADEAAHTDEMQDADTSIKQTTNRFIFGSTPKGLGNFFAQAMIGGIIPGVVKFWMWWPEHPILDITWYNDQRNHMTDEAIAQELDINFTLSVGGRVLNEVTTDWFVVIPTDPPNKWGYDPRLDIEVIIDPGFADALAAFWVQWDYRTQKGRIIDFVQTERKAIDWMVPFITGQIPMHTYIQEPWKHDYSEVEHQIIERHRVWSAPKFVYGDAAGGAKQVNTGTSTWDEIARYNIFVDEIKITDDEDALKRLELFMRHVRFSKHLLDQRNGPKQFVPTVFEIVTQWRYPKYEEGTNTQPRRKPIHDRYCHGGDCLKMWAQTKDLPDAQESGTAEGRLREARGDDILLPDDGDNPFRGR